MSSKQSDAAIKARQRMVEAAERYAQADRSDPFAFRRAMTQIKLGIASSHRGANDEMGAAAGKAYADAERQMATREVRTTRGIERVPTVVFTNVMRP